MRRLDAIMGHIISTVKALNVPSGEEGIGNASGQHMQESSPQT